MKDPRDPSLASFNLLIPTESDHKFPEDMMLLTSEEAVTRRLAAAGLNRSDFETKLSNSARPDGHVRTHLQLSEIAFDRALQHAVLVFSASCGCKGGDGGVAVYRGTPDMDGVLKR